MLNVKAGVFYFLFFKLECIFFFKLIFFFKSRDTLKGVVVEAGFSGSKLAHERMHERTNQLTD